MTEETVRAMIRRPAGNGRRDHGVPRRKVVRERIYFGDPWEPPAWRARWVERFDPREPDRPL
jgi:hypothetical protein